jgi:hypothetical protein
MSFERQWHVAVAPEVVVDALRENTREWRESLIPRPLWKGGVLQVIGEYSPAAFRLRYDRRWQRSRGGDPLELRGEVSPNPHGGTDIRVRCGMTAGFWIAPIILSCSAVLIAWSSLWSAAFFALLAVINWAWRSISNDAVTAGSNAEADYLVARVEEALASVQASGGHRAPGG